MSGEALDAFAAEPWPSFPGQPSAPLTADGGGSTGATGATWVCALEGDSDTEASCDVVRLG